MMARHRKPETAVMTALGVKTAADWRSNLYVWLPVLTGALVTAGVATEAQAALWAGLVVGVAGPAVMAWRSRTISTLRPVLYSVLGGVQALAIGYGLADDEHVGVWLPILATVIAALGGGLGGANTPTSSAWTRNVNGEADPSAPVVVE